MSNLGVRLVYEARNELSKEGAWAYGLSRISIADCKRNLVWTEFVPDSIVSGLSDQELDSWGQSTTRMGWMYMKSHLPPTGINRT